jgi:DNA-binding SARP family transcriptional activator
MNDSFLWPERVRKISVASYMWFLPKILQDDRPPVCVSRRHVTLGIITHLLTL